MDKNLAYALTAQTRGLRKTLKTPKGDIVELPATVSIYSYLLKGYKLIKLNGENPSKYLPPSYKFLFEEEKKKEIKPKKVK